MVAIVRLVINGRAGRTIERFFQPTENCRSTIRSSPSPAHRGRVPVACSRGRASCAYSFDEMRAAWRLSDTRDLSAHPRRTRRGGSDLTLNLLAAESSRLALRVLAASALLWRGLKSMRVASWRRAKRSTGSFIDRGARRTIAPARFLTLRI